MVTPLTAGLDSRLTRQSRFDLCAGPTLGYVSYGDFGVGEEILSIDDDFTWGATVGMARARGLLGPWRLAGAVRATVARGQEGG